MIISKRIIEYGILLLIVTSCHSDYDQKFDFVPARQQVTLNQAHIGSLHIDTLLLDSYEAVPENIRQFYLDARMVLTENINAEFTDTLIIESARKNKIPLLGGPMLGNLTEDGVTIWLRTVKPYLLRVKVKRVDGSERKSYFIKSSVPGEEKRIVLNGLTSDSEYNYFIYSRFRRIAEGSFRTAPAPEEEGLFKLAFGSCFHKIGLHNPNLITQILSRQPHAMLLVGDIAVDDRYNNINMHRSDYLLRDVSLAWQNLSSNVPIYSAWDDHDYLDNDLSGIPDSLSIADQQALREVWFENWNNPEYKGEGIYFNTRIGPVELIMLDTRSCRDVERRGEYSSYLGPEQQTWLVGILKRSTATFKVITSGTMWSDYISNGKDSWGTWDTIAREEIFNLIETENIPDVILISGDRHGARAFKIPLNSDIWLYELEVASLGGVPGPKAMAKDSANQIFGYTGIDIKAYGEIIFDTEGDEPHVSFRLINELGNILEEHALF